MVLLVTGSQSQSSSSTLAQAVSKFKQAIAIDSTRHDTKWCLGNAYTSQVPPPAGLMPCRQTEHPAILNPQTSGGKAPCRILCFCMNDPNMHDGGALGHVRLRNGAEFPVDAVTATESTKLLIFSSVVQCTLCCGTGLPDGGFWQGAGLLQAGQGSVRRGPQAGASLHTSPIPKPDRMKCAGPPPPPSLPPRPRRHTHTLYHAHFYSPSRNGESNPGGRLQTPDGAAVSTHVLSRPESQGKSQLQQNSCMQCGLSGKGALVGLVGGVA